EPRAPPPTTSSSVAITGRPAAYHGQRDQLSQSTAATPSAARPPQASRPVEARRSHPRPLPSRKAHGAPPPGSPALLGSEKKAHGWETSIHRTQPRKDTSVSTAATTKSRRSLRRHTQNPSARIAGQKR